MFVDKVRIQIKAGDGGDGCTSFYTEKYVSNGGPDGGDGGKGGDVVFVADAGKSSLIDFAYASKFKADSGEKGSHRFCNGKSGKDLVISVPVGTVIRDAESGGIVADLFSDGDRVIALKGGLGGKGNARFKSARRQAPHFSQRGEVTEFKTVILELMTVADVGLVGFPNVGKSTLLSVVSAARPKIADYHFTTLSPNLGVVKSDDGGFVLADIPGLIEGASDGAGLGHEFLRHISRVRLIVHVIDLSGIEGRDPISDYYAIRNELSSYGDGSLSELPEIVALNKADVADAAAYDRFVKEINVETHKISAVTHLGVDELMNAVRRTLATLPPPKPIEYEPFVYERPATTGFEISRASDGAFIVSGGLMDALARNVVLDNYDSFSYFQKRLREEGVIKALKKAGIADGDTVRILDVEFDFVE